MNVLKNIYDYIYCLYHDFAFLHITLINDQDQYIFYTKHIYHYVQNKARALCSKMLIHERLAVTYLSFNLYLFHTWPLSSRADSHHCSNPLFCHNSQGLHNSCCSFVNSSLRKTLLNILKGMKLKVSLTWTIQIV